MSVFHSVAAHMLQGGAVLTVWYLTPEGNGLKMRYVGSATIFITLFSASIVVELLQRRQVAADEMMSRW